MPESTDKGGRKPRVTDADLLGVFRETTDPVLSTAEVSDALPIKRRGTLNRLRALEAEGALDSKQIGGRNTVWWVIDETDESRPESVPSGSIDGSPEATLDAESDDLDTEGTPSVGEGISDEKVRKETAPAPDDLAEDVRQYLEATDRPPKTEHGRDAVIDVFRYLREHGTAKTGEMKEALAPDHADRYTGETAMWESVRRYLEDIPGIEKAGYEEYGYAGDESVRTLLKDEASDGGTERGSGGNADGAQPGPDAEEGGENG